MRVQLNNHNADLRDFVQSIEVKRGNEQRGNTNFG